MVPNLINVVVVDVLHHNIHKRVDSRAIYHTPRIVHLYQGLPRLTILRLILNTRVDIIQRVPNLLPEVTLTVMLGEVAIEASFVVLVFQPKRVLNGGVVLVTPIAPASVEGHWLPGGDLE